MKCASCFSVKRSLVSCTTLIGICYLPICNERSFSPFANGKTAWSYKLALLAHLTIVRLWRYFEVLKIIKRNRTLIVFYRFTKAFTHSWCSYSTFYKVPSWSQRMNSAFSSLNFLRSYLVSKIGIRRFVLLELFISKAIYVKRCIAYAMT